VLNQTLSERQFLCGDEYNIADMAVYSWYGQLVLTGLYESKEFLQVESYTHVLRWANEIPRTTSSSAWSKSKSRE
jgi:GST-like protein